MKRAALIALACLLLACGQYSIITFGDSWSGLSIVHLEAQTGCPVFSQTHGGSATPQLLGEFWTDFEAELRAKSGPVLVYLSIGALDDLIWEMPPEQSATDIAGLVNLIHAANPAAAVVHAGYDDPFTTKCADEALLNHPLKYECVLLDELPVEYFENDPLHLKPEWYAARVELLWQKSYLLREAFGTCQE